MRPINAISVTSDVYRWLTYSSRPRVLHIFDHTCNLINERGEVLSIVTSRIGNGPFNVLVDTNILFSKDIYVESQVTVLDSQLRVGNLIVNITGAELWNSCPDWVQLYRSREIILNQLQSLDLQNVDHAAGFANVTRSYFNTGIPSLLSKFSSALANADFSTAKSTATKLAGLGVGLTPSGDDFIVGALYAVWIIHSREVASVLAREIAKIAMPLTTSLSAAWLRSAGKGEAGILWHEFFEALIAEDDLQIPFENLLTVGETSGADALSGFQSVITAFKERIINECPS